MPVFVTHVNKTPCLYITNTVYGYAKVHWSGFGQPNYLIVINHGLNFSSNFPDFIFYKSIST